ncbi:MAG TPA: NUDIX domain-containing protein [Candidatus Angelobacter sp.]|nr:NUDIX domain-containing protein [Candidatus Angelobacter sp.]
MSRLQTRAMPSTFALGERLKRMKENLSSNPRSRSDEHVDAVVGILLHQESADELNTLLIHRVERSNDPWSGQIGLPGGRVEKFDGSTREALEREVREEVGLELSEEGELLGLLSVSHPGRRIEMRVQPWVYGLHRRPEVTSGPEIQHAFWVSLSKLPSLKGTSEVEIRGTRILVEGFLVDGRVVWGFTYRVLNELLTVLGVM